MEKRKLVFYKRSRLPWTNSDLALVQAYCGDIEPWDVAVDYERSVLKYLYDDGCETEFMYLWSEQHPPSTYKKVAFEDAFRLRSTRRRK